MIGRTFLGGKNVRFLHTADWHIGKKLHGYDLLNDQKESINQIIEIAEKEKVEAIVIAGDLYDRAVPAVEAVELLNQKLIEINLEKKFPLLAISGNHDSASRLATGQPWYRLKNFQLHTKMTQAFEPIEFVDTQFFLLPYFEPMDASFYFQEEIRTIQQAFEKVIPEIKKQFDPHKKHVLVTHFFITGSLRTESETTIEVGGLNGLSKELFKDFDYTALGHLHSKNAIRNGKIRYSGSPLKFSLSETNDEKGVFIVDTLTETVDFHSLKPIRDVKVLQASFQELLTPNYYQKLDRTCFWQFELKDRAIIPNMMNQLRSLYPFVLGVQRINGRNESVKLQELQKRSGKPEEMLTSFFEDITGDSLTKSQLKWLQEGIQAANDQEVRD